MGRPVQGGSGASWLAHWVEGDVFGKLGRLKNVLFNVFLHLLWEVLYSLGIVPKECSKSNFQNMVTVEHRDLLGSVVLEFLCTY